MHGLQYKEYNAYNTVHRIKSIEYRENTKMHIIKPKQNNAKNIIQRVQWKEYNTASTMHKIWCIQYDT